MTDEENELIPKETSGYEQSQDLEGGFLFGSDNTFEGVIKKTKSSETKLIKNYENMETATKEYNKSFKDHVSNLNKLDDYANFSGMKNLFRKVIMKDVITSGAKVDTSMPLLFRNYHIEKEPTPSAFRREHILTQVRYILATSFAGRESMLVKYMSVELGKSQFILHITTIENIKKSRTLDHNGYVIDAGGTRAALKDILSATKKNLKRGTALVDIDRGSSTDSSRKKKRTKKSSNGGLSSLLGSRNRTKDRSRTKSNRNSNNTDNYNRNIGNSRESIKSLTRRKHEPSNNELSSMDSLKSIIIKTQKQSKPSMYKRPSEKRAEAGIAAIATPGAIGALPGQAPVMPLAPGAFPPMQFSPDLAAKNQGGILGAPQNLLAPLPQPGMGQMAPMPGDIPQQPYQKPKMCKEHLDQGSCQSDSSCYWNAKYQSCAFSRPRNGAGAPGAPGGFGAAGQAQASPPPGFGGFPGMGVPAAAQAPLPPPPTMNI